MEEEGTHTMFLVGDRCPTLKKKKKKKFPHMSIVKIRILFCCCFVVDKNQKNVMDFNNNQLRWVFKLSLANSLHLSTDNWK
jgi:hypothetical protein